MSSFEITPIGTVRNDRTDVQHMDNWGAVRSTVTVDEQPEWVSGLMSEYVQP
jgi:tRNA (adenine37-N6)-methyltransferase